MLKARHITPIITLKGVSNFSKIDIYLHNDLDYFFLVSLSILLTIFNYLFAKSFSSFLSFFNICLSFEDITYFLFF
jgi:hypothetical protein